LCQLLNNLFVLIIQIYLLYRCNILYNNFFSLSIFYQSIRIAPRSSPGAAPAYVGRRGSRRRSRRYREDRPSRTRVCRREERHSIATSLSWGASPGGKPMTPPPLPPPRASARPLPLHGNRPAHPPWRRWVRVRSERRLPTTLLRKHGDHGALPPCPKIMSKHDEDMGYIGKKNISVQLWLVCVDSTQRMIKKHVYSVKKHTFCQHARWSAARGTSSYKIKNELLSL